MHFQHVPSQIDFIGKHDVLGVHALCLFAQVVISLEVLLQFWVASVILVIETTSRTEVALFVGVSKVRVECVEIIKPFLYAVLLLLLVGALVTVVTSLRVGVIIVRTCLVKRVSFTNDKQHASLATYRIRRQGVLLPLPLLLPPPSPPRAYEGRRA